MGRKKVLVEDEEFEVENIVAHRTIKGRREYKIRWRGYEEVDDTWEVEDNLNCAPLIEEYLSNVNIEEAANLPVPNASRKRRQNGPANGEAAGPSSASSAGPSTAQSTGPSTASSAGPSAADTSPRPPKKAKTVPKSSKTSMAKNQEAAPSTSSRSLRTPKTPPPVTKKSSKAPPIKKKAAKTKKKSDNKEYEVERIEKMKPGRNGKRMFLIHWVGYNKATWEPEDNLKGTSILKRFLKTQQ